MVGVNDAPHSQKLIRPTGALDAERRRFNDRLLLRLGPRRRRVAAARPEPQPRVRFPALPAAWPFVCYRRGARARSRGRAGELARARAPARARRARGRAVYSCARIRD